MFLSKSDIVAKQWPVEDVELPEFEGKKVRVKTLSASEFLALAELERKYPNRGYALWWVSCVCGPDGTPLFDETDIEFITTLPISAVNKVVDAAKRVNRIPEAKGDDAPNA